ncbi:uncharacterized protein CDAR_506111 [Caerostris darwini]|uniref:Uncharacterized protein n=1 Tax=Caerostris darwini TaxID=1538125 RepID=A0AAV4WJT0_9ARAC|nr:uncharacterized protein CDAR_506111 [Caerostris darwini]
MYCFTKCLVFLSILCYVVVSSEESSRTFTSNSTKVGRTGRKNYGFYRPQPPRDYGDDGDDKEDSTDEAQPGPSSGNPPQPSDYPSFNNYKGYEQYSNYGPPRYPSFAPNYYKGSPFYSPYWKGSKPADSGMAPASPDQMMEMMMALNNMDESSKPEDTGLLSKLISDPKSAAAAAIIPLSIVAAAVVPVLMNYMMTGAAPQVVSTTANNKESRSLDSSNNLQVVMENIASLARAIDSDECIQKTICRVANGNDSMPVSDYMKKAATTVAQIVKDDWVNNLGVKNLVDGVKQGNCDNVCNSSKNTA